MAIITDSKGQMRILGPRGGVVAIDTRGLSDSELIIEVRKYPNGEYATKICKGCGCYYVGESGGCHNVVSRCINCVDGNHDK